MADDFRAGPQYTNDSDAQGRRVRLRPKPNATYQIYGSGGILEPLRKTNGMVFPYQPTISYQQDVTYSSIDLVHTNQELYAFTRSNAVKLVISGQFSAQNQTEGSYALACIHFLRTVTKMWFGASPNPGTPPPVLLFDAYGQYMFNQLPVIVTSFTVGLPNDVDYVPINLSKNGISGTMSTGSQTDKRSSVEKSAAINTWASLANVKQTSSIMFKENLTGSSGYVWLPSVFTIDVSITVQNTPSRLRQFNFDQFKTGALLRGGKWL